MSSDGVTLYNSIDAERWVKEYEKNEADLISYAASCRTGRKPYVERRNKIIDRAVDAGLDRQALVDELKMRALDRKKAEIVAAQSEDVAEAALTLREMLGGLANLPLGEAAIRASTAPKKDAIPDFSNMTLDEARAVLAEPMTKGRPKKAVLARKKAAKALLAQQLPPSDGASGEQAEAIAAAMGDDVAAAEDTRDALDNVRDLRPRFMQEATPSDAA